MTASFHAHYASRLLAGILSEPGVLELCDDVETLDFPHPYQRVAFAALRSLQVRGESVAVLAVCDEIRRVDAALGLCRGEWVHEAYLVELLRSTRSYNYSGLVRYDGAMYLDGVEVDWPAFLDQRSRWDCFARNSDLYTPEQLARMRDRDYLNLTDDERAELRREDVLRDVATLLFYRRNPEVLDDEQLAIPVQVSNDNQRLRKQRVAHHRRARRAVG